MIAPYKFDPKPASGSDLFFFDWSDWITPIPGDAIDLTSMVVTASPADLVVSDITVNGYVVRCRLSGGTANLTYTVTCTVTTTPSRRTDSASATMYITR